MATARVGEGLAGRLADGEQLFQALFDANIIGVVIADHERVIEANDAFLRAAGLHRPDVDAGLVGRSHAPPGRVGGGPAPRAGGPVEPTFPRPDGTVVPVLVGGATVQPVPFRMVAL